MNHKIFLNICIDNVYLIMVQFMVAQEIQRIERILRLDNQGKSYAYNWDKQYLKQFNTHCMTDQLWPLDHNN